MFGLQRSRTVCAALSAAVDTFRTNPLGRSTSLPPVTATFSVDQGPSERPHCKRQPLLPQSSLDLWAVFSPQGSPRKFIQQEETLAAASPPTLLSGNSIISTSIAVSWSSSCTRTSLDRRYKLSEGVVGWPGIDSGSKGDRMWSTATLFHGLFQLTYRHRLFHSDRQGSDVLTGHDDAPGSPSVFAWRGAKAKQELRLRRTSTGDFSRSYSDGSYHQPQAQNRASDGDEQTTYRWRVDQLSPAGGSPGTGGHVARAAAGGSFSSGGSAERKRDIVRDYLWIVPSLLIYTAPVAGAAYLFLHPILCLPTLCAWMAAEVGFYFWYLERRRTADALRSHPPIDFHDREETFKRLLALRSEDVNILDFVSQWFRGAPIEIIKRQNVRELLAYGFFCSTLEDLSSVDRKRVDSFIVEAEENWNVHFPEGYNPDLEYMAHTQEEIRYLHRPLAIFAWSHTVALLVSIALLARGYQRYRMGQLIYWYRPAYAAPKSAGEESDHPHTPPAPLVFIHGIGIGLAPYLHFIDKLSEPEKPMVVVELPHVAMRLVPSAPSIDELVDAVELIRERHGFGPATFIGHSYGSLVVARLHKRFPGAVAQMALLDPVCFLLCLPDVLFNFLYKDPKTHTMEVTDAIRYYVCSREIHIVEALSRRFWWYALQLWTDELPDKVLVSLSECDAIVPSAAVRRHLQHTHAKVLWHKKLPHGGFLFSPDKLDEIVNNLRSL